MKGAAFGILTLLFLTGCTSQAPTDGTHETTGEIAAGSPADAAWNLLAFDGQQQVNTTQWLNGTFALADACSPIGCITGTAFRALDITEHLPPDVPVRVRALLNYSTNQPLFAQPILMGLRAPSATTYAYQEDVATPGHIAIEATLLRRGDPIYVDLLYGMPAAAEAETKYELRLDVWGHPHLVPGGVPILVQTEPTTKLRVETLTGTSGNVLVYAPDDSFLGVVKPSADGTIWDDRQDNIGEHVFVFPESTPWININATNVTSPMRALDLQNAYSTPRPVAGQALAWSFEVDRRPLHVGIYEANMSLLVAAYGNSRATLASPEGTVADGPLGCGSVCVTGGVHFQSVRSLTGNPLNIPGQYEARYVPTQEAGVQVGHFVTHYRR